MIIIGEKINGTIPPVKKAIQEKDADFIANRAIKQAEAGATYIDVCASTAPDIEVETLKWLMDIVQDAVDTPLAIDSPDPRALEAVFKYAKKPGLINSVSLEAVSEGVDKCDVIFPLMEGNDWEVVALTCDKDGIAADIDKKVEITTKIVEKAAKYGITPDRIHVDPCVMALSTENTSLLNFIESINRIKEIYPTIKITSGLSNISFGLPARKLVNSNFMALSIYAGMDSAVMDPLNRDIMGTIFATEALLNRDKHCRKFSKAFRQGRIGPKK